MQKYPAWRYHASEAARIVADPAEEAALGPGWADTPAAFAARPDGEQARPHGEREADPQTPAKPKKGKSK